MSGRFQGRDSNFLTGLLIAALNNPVFESHEKVFSLALLFAWEFTPVYCMLNLLQC